MFVLVSMQWRNHADTRTVKRLCGERLCGMYT